MDLLYWSSKFLTRSPCALSVLVLLACFTAYSQQLCLSNERIALLRFKDSFVINKEVCDEPGSYPKTSSWANNDECCSWDGVECDNITGHVIGLDLTSSCLNGAFDSGSSLFELTQLQFLSLRDNGFNYGRIPSRLGNLSRLEYLDLSISDFVGQIPLEICQLGNLIYLGLKELYVNSTIPRSLGNLSSLVVLSMERCYLHGGFPDFLLQLPNLEILDLETNMHLSGPLPEFPAGSSLKKLLLYYTSFSGSIPFSIGNLKSLNKFTVSQCQFSGLLPSSLGNLTKLTHLGLSENNFAAQIIPSFLQNLTDLTELLMDDNQFFGVIPPWLGNITQLTDLSLGYNKLKGHIPDSFSRFINLESLLLPGNDLSGTINLNMFFDLRNLKNLLLSNNKLSVLPETTSANATVSKFEVLRLRSCNLTKFPIFLRYQQKLRILDLGKNQIYGQIPNWVLNTSTNSLLNLDFSGNALTSFDRLRPSAMLPWVNLVDLDLSQNMLKGPIPIPPLSTVIYYASNNTLSGEISPMFCNLSSLEDLDLSNNKLSSSIPKCFERLGKSLTILNLRNNSLQGSIPEMCIGGRELSGADLSDNLLEGYLPRSFGNCTELEILNLGNNQLHDTFPFWLGILPELKILLLPRNRLHGTISQSVSDTEFLKLRIIDLSHNSFSGSLPANYFKQWGAMKNVDNSRSAYLSGQLNYYTAGIHFLGHHLYSMTIMNKGLNLFYKKIQEVFVVIDLSSNRFRGEIPECMGALQGLQVLNLSNNNLTAEIPASLGSIASLESLDLSQNRLSGKIPRELARLTFLAFFDVSNNNLSGPIPRGHQLDTFGNDSYAGNSGLCGDPLSRRCGNTPETPPAPTRWVEQEGHGLGSWFESNRMEILSGYLGGLVVGVVIEHLFMAKYTQLAMLFLLRHLNTRRRLA